MIETQDTVSGDTAPNDQIVDQTPAATAPSSAAHASEDQQPKASAKEQPTPAADGAASEVKKEAPAAKKAPIDPRHRHFKHLSPRAHQWIEKNCGKWVLEAMRMYLFDPDRVFPDWGTRFAVTLRDIGKDEVIRMGEAEVLYDYVMTTPFWEINYQIRKKLLATKPNRKRSSAHRSGNKSSGDKSSGNKNTGDKSSTDKSSAAKPAEQPEPAGQNASTPPSPAPAEATLAKPTDTPE